MFGKLVDFSLKWLVFDSRPSNERYVTDLDQR